MRILLTGKNGQLGRCFQDKTIGCKHEVFTYGSNELDIADLDTVIRIVNQIKPDIIVNAAAYTAVDKAETDSELAYTVNELGVKHLAAQAAARHIPLIHVSTDYVFDGDAIEPYTPDSKTNPQSIYGTSKLAGEKVVQEICEKYVILRTSWVFSEYGFNFVKTMLRLAKERDEISVVADQYGCPTYAGDLAQAILTLCDRYEQEETVKTGVYHYCGDTPTSWHGFARTIFAKAYELGVIEKVPRLKAISSDQYPTPVKRPEYSVMKDGNLSLYGVYCSDWLSSLSLIMKRI